GRRGPEPAASQARGPVPGGCSAVQRRAAVPMARARGRARGGARPAAGGADELLEPPPLRGGGTAAEGGGGGSRQKLCVAERPLRHSLRECHLPLAGRIEVHSAASRNRSSMSTSACQLLSSGRTSFANRCMVLRHSSCGMPP